MIFGPGLPGPIGPTGATGATGPAGPAGAPGKVLQVVHASTTTEVTISGSAGWTDTTLTATITPSLASSSILVLVSQHVLFHDTGNALAVGGYGGLRLLRGSTVVWKSREATGDLPASIGALTYAVSSTLDQGILFVHTPINYTDSPATTSAVTYKTQIRSGNANAQFSAIAQQAGTASNGQSNIILMEIAA